MNRHAALAAVLVLALAPACAQVRNGIDVLRTDRFEALQGMRVGLVTNHTGRARDGTSTIRLLHDAPGVDLRVLFAPEHGIEGVLDEENIGDAVEKGTGLRVVSLYKSEKRRPTPEQMKGLDALVFDIQDIGTRFYTYISTMGHCMQAASEAGIAFVVLDRVNPVNGTIIDGPVYRGEPTFTAYHALPIRHAMTVGELATMFRTERKWRLDLRVVRVAGWKRGMHFDETGLRWVDPSPNMRSLEAAILYPGVALLEFTNVSVGRGTETPFEIFGAPFIKAKPFAAELRRASIPGVEFDPVDFTPRASRHAGVKCGGVRIRIRDRDRLPSVDLGLVLAQALLRLHPQEFEYARFAKLLAHEPTFAAVRRGDSRTEIRRSWERNLDLFRKRRATHLLYR